MARNALGIARFSGRSGPRACVEVHRPRDMKLEREVALKTRPAIGGASWHALPGEACIGEGQTAGVFDIVLDPFVCFYKVEFDDENGIIFYSDTICFECEKPVQVDQRSWGSLKAQYR